MKAPKFWYHTSFMGCLLSPLGKIYAAAVKKRLSGVVPFESRLPVICVGNLVAGGAGKTPTVMAIVDMLQDEGQTPHVLLRGYGGALKGPVEVGRTAHRITDVGDEALLLSQQTPTWVSADRGKGAEAIQRQGLASIIVMDDGFQNPTLKKDMSLIVVDGAVGFGNGRVMPAGPLREPLKQGLSRADAVVLVGDDIVGVTEQVKQYTDIPILRASLTPAEETGKFKDRKVVGFAGIGRPEKFRETLEEIGATIVGWHSFPDHYNYSMAEVWKMVDEATDKEALAVTTEKDFVRLTEEAQAKIETVAVRLVFEDEGEVLALLNSLKQKAAA